MCCAGQPVLIVGDFNADPIVIPSLAKGVMDGHWIDLEQAFATGRGVAPSHTCQFQLDEDKGSRRDLVLACPIAMAAAAACRVFARSLVHSGFFCLCGVRSLCLDATVERARVYSPLWPACWLTCLDRSGRSPSHAVQNIWDVHVQEVGFVPREVGEKLFAACSTPDVDSSWSLWSREAEASLSCLSLCWWAPPLSNPGSYVGRGQLSIYTMRLGGRCHDRIYRVDHADEFDDTNSGFFINSSLALVLRFRRRFVSVCNVLKGIKVHGFSEARISALLSRWHAVVRMGPTGPVTSFEPWTHWIPPDLHGCYKWAMDTLALLNEFVLKVVRHRQTSRLQAWSNWIREDLASHPYPMASSGVCSSGSLSGLQARRPPLMGLVFWFSPPSLMSTFGRHGCPIFVEMGILLSPLKPSLNLLVIIFHKKPFWIFPFLRVRIFMRLSWPRNPLLAVLMAGPGMRLKRFLSWFIGPFLGSSANRSCW